MMCGVVDAGLITLKYFRLLLKLPHSASAHEYTYLLDVKLHVEYLWLAAQIIILTRLVTLRSSEFDNVKHSWTHDMHSKGRLSYCSNTLPAALFVSFAEWFFDFGFVMPGSTNSWQQTIESAGRDGMLSPDDLRYLRTSCWSSSSAPCPDWDHNTENLTFWRIKR